MSDDPQMQWHAAWVRAWAKMPPIPKTHKAKIKTKSGPDYEYSYADLPDILDAVRLILTAEGLALTQSVELLGDELIGVVTRIYHTGGWVETFGPTPMPAAGDPRAIGSAITYARRYAVSAALGIASDEDTDAEATQGRGAKRVEQPSQPPVEPTMAPAEELAAFTAAPAAELAAAHISVQRSRLERAYAAADVDLTAALEAFGASGEALSPPRPLKVLNDLGTKARYSAFSVWSQSYLRGLTSPT